MEHGTMRLSFVNVGYGEAIVIECPDPAAPSGVFTALVDGGSAEPQEFAHQPSGRIPLWTYFARRGLGHIDLAVSTHIHEDHICGLSRALQSAPPGALLQSLPPDTHRRMRRLDAACAATALQGKLMRALNDYAALCALTEDSGGAVEQVQAMQQRTLCPGLSLQVLGPSAQAQQALANGIAALYNEQEGSAAFLQCLDALDAGMNNRSVVLRLDFRGTRVLLPGDTNAAGYAGIDPEQLSAHIFKVGHHGQRDGADEALVRAVHPQAVVCCASSDRRYNSAHPDTLHLLCSQGAELYCSDCPQVPGGVIPPHQVLEFTLGPAGAWRARYLSEA